MVMQLVNWGITFSVGNLTLLYLGSIVFFLFKDKEASKSSWKSRVSSGGLPVVGIPAFPIKAPGFGLIPDFDSRLERFGTH